VFDNSHISGTSAVSAMIVAGPEGLVKNQYRKFNIRSVDLAPGDDYAMMREVLTRRFKRLAAGPCQPEPGTMLASEAGSISALDTADLTPLTRITPPGPAPIDERGANAIAFGVLRADTTVADPEDLTPAAEAFPDRPDLVLIDGGKGQLGAAVAALEELGLGDQPVASLAKREELIFVRGRDEPIVLPRSSPVLQLVQRVRDEAHRFAIGYHRKTRSARTIRSELDDIPGVGPTKRRVLLSRFGSVRSVRGASEAELAAVVGKSTAARVRAYFDVQTTKSAQTR